MSALPIQSDPLRSLIPPIKELAVMPQVAYRIMDLADGDVSSPDFIKLVAIDPGFYAKVLARANATGFRLIKDWFSIKEALEAIGGQGVNEIAAESTKFVFFAGKTDHVSLRQRCWWRHSVDTAVCGNWLSAVIKVGTRDMAYACGLLHYLGKTILLSADPGAYEELDEKLHTPAEMVEFEREHFGFDHTQVSRAAMEAWSLPKPLWTALSYLQPSADPNAAMLAISSCIAGLAVSGNEGNRTSLPEWALECLHIPLDDAHVLAAQGIAEIAASEVAQL